MKANHIIRRFLFLAILSIFSPTPAEALGGYAIDLISCNPTQQLFLEAQLKRATTIGKFVSLNLGSNINNRQGWYLDGFIMNFVTLLMGNYQDALINAQWVFGGAFGLSSTGIVGFAANPLDQGLVGPYDVVLYCDADRLSTSFDGYRFDPDSARTTGNTAILPSNAGAGCTEIWEPGAPTYVSWQLSADAARITFCQWFLEVAMRTAVPSTSIFADTRRIDELRDRVAAWSPNWGPWGFGTPTPNIQNFQLFDAIMIAALTHTVPAGSRQRSSVIGLTSFANVVSLANNQATRYSNGAFMYLALVIFAYRSGITVNNDGSFGPNRATTYQDWGDPNQNWAIAWTPPYPQPPS